MAEKRAAIRQAIEEVHSKQKNVGLSVAVLLSGEIVFSEGLGYADLEHEVAVTRETRFEIASITKAFTGAALLTLVEQGRIDLDAPIQRYVPGFPEKPEGTITLRLLALHRAGIRHYRDNERTAEFFARHYDDVLEALALFQDDPLLAAPGERESYSSYGYNLLAAAVEGVSGKRFQDYIAETILEPLELAHTQFDDVRFLVPHRARRYSYYHPTTYAPGEKLYVVPTRDYSYNLGGGNLLSTAEDLVRFGHAFVQPGLLSQESLELLLSPLTPEVESAWTYGWAVRRDKAGRRYLRMTGANPGTQGALVVYPEQDVVVAILANTWGIGSDSAEMVTSLPERVAALFLVHREARE